MMFGSKNKKIIMDLRKELDETRERADLMRERWHDGIDTIADLKKQLEVKEEECRIKVEASMSLVHKGNQYFSDYIVASRENAILRQILEDISGKKADELLEAHKRAVRLLEYGVEVKNGISEDCEGQSLG